MITDDNDRTLLQELAHVLEDIAQAMIDSDNHHPQARQRIQHAIIAADLAREGLVMLLAGSYPIQVPVAEQVDPRHGAPQ